MKLVGVKVSNLRHANWPVFLSIVFVSLSVLKSDREGKKIDMLDDTGAYNMCKYDMI